ncbi:MAG TPA: hypothetical protein VJN48_15050, partial [Terriglobales bacterium]|nr:hypothetical protein [Terriglobales bacterium]
MTAFSASPPVERLDVSVFTVPTDSPESDGTLKWDKTTMVLVEVLAGGHNGLGYTYTDASAANLIHNVLSAEVKGRDPMAVTAAYMAMWRRIRNLGRPGICSAAISAVDCALWDLKARLLGTPLATLLGQVRAGAQVYGSGGFTSYSDKQLAGHLAGWVEQGIPAVKMKIGREPRRD